jgi:hypothetical protein
MDTHPLAVGIGAESEHRSELCQVGWAAADDDRGIERCKRLVHGGFEA